jgi:DNA-binding FadR family transcriptional regulator
VFEDIIVQIEQAIAKGDLKPGDRLPPERELAETFGVSRPSVREALRVLEMFGVVVARRGTGAEGGSLVAEGAQVGLVSALRLHSALVRVPSTDLVELRVVLEAYAAGRAATEVDPERTAELRRLIEDMRAAGSAEVFYRLDTDFHLELSRVSGNRLAPALMEALREAMAREMLKAFAVLPDFDAQRAVLIEGHARIVEAIESGDSEEAATAVREHIEGFYRHVAARVAVER